MGASDPRLPWLVRRVYTVAEATRPGVDEAACGGQPSTSGLADSPNRALPVALTDHRSRDPVPSRHADGIADKVCRGPAEAPPALRSIRSGPPARHWRPRGPRCGTPDVARPYDGFESYARGRRRRPRRDRRGLPAHFTGARPIAVRGGRVLRRKDQCDRRDPPGRRTPGIASTARSPTSPAGPGRGWDAAPLLGAKKERGVQRVLDVNLVRRTWIWSSDVREVMIEAGGGGRIVNLPHPRRPAEGRVADDRRLLRRPKAGVINLTQVMAKEWAASRILDQRRVPRHGRRG